MLHKIGQLTVDIREIACIGDRENVSGHACGFNIWLKGGGKIFVLIEGVGKEERNNYDGPVLGKLIDRTDKEISELIKMWRDTVTQTTLTAIG